MTPKTRNYLLRNIPEELWRRIKSTAALQGISIKQLILEAIEKKMAGKEK